MRTRLPANASFFQRITYPAMRSISFFWFIYIPYAPIRRVRKPSLEGPFLWACSHSNFMCDGIPASYEAPVPTKFLVKSTLFHFPVARFLAYCGALPLMRAADFKDLDPAVRAEQNRATFRVAIEALRAGWPVAIYPEGVSNEAPGLTLPLKPGAAKLALAAEEANGFALGLRIVPVGLEYGNRVRVGSGLNIRYGHPIPVKEYEAVYRQNPEEAARQITERLTRELLANFPHFADETKQALGRKLAAFGLCRNKYEAAQLFLAQEGNAAFWEELGRRLHALESASKEFGVPIPAWGYRRVWRDLGPARRWRRWVFLVLGFPLFLLDLLNSTLPDFFLTAFTEFISIDQTEVMSKRLIAAPVVLGLLYGLQFWALGWIGFPRGWLAYVLYTAASYVLWYFAVHWRRQCKRLASLFFFWRAGLKGSSETVVQYRELGQYLRQFQDHRG